jgi:hypothetical protein
MSGENLIPVHEFKVTSEEAQARRRRAARLSDVNRRLASIRNDPNLVITCVFGFSLSR